MPLVFKAKSQPAMVQPQAPPAQAPLQPSHTKYGQLACGLCKREPPLGETTLCYDCTQKQKEG